MAWRAVRRCITRSWREAAGEARGERRRHTEGDEGKGSKGDGDKEEECGEASSKVERLLLLPI